MGDNRQSAKVSEKYQLFTYGEKMVEEIKVGAEMSILYSGEFDSITWSFKVSCGIVYREITKIEGNF